MEASGAGANGPTSTSTTTSTSGGAGGADAQTWTMGSPFSTSAPPFENVSHPLPPSPLWGAGEVAPYPTNAEWMNLVIGDGKNPINVLPYVVNALEGGFEISAPKRVITDKSIGSAIEHDLSFRVAELSPMTRAITGHDLLSVTVQWSADGGKSITAPLVRGMPYATAIYTGLTPFIGSTHAILSVNGATTSPGTNDHFTIAFNNGQTWVLYATPSITFTLNAIGLTADKPFNGVLRAALVGAAPGAVDVLNAHRDAYPVGGGVAATVTGDTAKIDFQWNKQGTGELLMMALPHHVDVLEGVGKTNLIQRTIKGDMVAVTGDTWTMTEPLSTITWSSPRPIVSDKKTDIRTALVADAAAAKPDAPDPYTFGKQVARFARLALIADELEEADLAAMIRVKMKASLDPWLQGKNQDALKYDKTWGGICSTDGLSSPTKDFGQGYYNDHHFHYGYFLYAAAVIAKADKAWFDANKEAILSLARDIANPSLEDKGFTPFRNKDWFTGHSWAAGLFEFGDSRNQESSSEAVNAWYGLYLLGLAAGDDNLANVGRVLLATEIHSTQTYWHIKKGSAIYDEPFASNKIVGVLWSNKVDYATFFCPAVECIHGIQMIPFTPISEALLEPAWVTEEYPVVSAALTPTSEQGWRGFVYMDHAVIDPNTAWNEVSGLTGYDSGNSSANTLHWVATRPAK
jgi:endo-1,3(4)-beta-glucanase